MANKQRTDGPPCLLCGNKLRPSRKTKGFQTEADAREFAELLDPDRHPRVREQASWRDNEWAVTYQAGWGKYGQNCFCSESCGYMWAIQRARPAVAKQQTGMGRMPDA